MGVQERRQREREARRKAVLDAARELVRERGYNGTTTKQIAAACELSEATLFWYFKSKDEIFTSLLFEAIDFMQQRIDALAASAGPATSCDAGTVRQSGSPELVLHDPAAASTPSNDAGGVRTAAACRLLSQIWGIFTELRVSYPEYFQVFTSLASPEATAAVSADVKAELVRSSGDNFRRVAELVGQAVTRRVVDLGIVRGEPGAQAGPISASPSPPDMAWTRIVTDVLWATFLGLGVLHDSRVNLGAPAHPTAPELDQALQVLVAGIAPSFTSPTGPAELGPESAESTTMDPPQSQPEEHR